jgi:hypothetical protein
MYGINKRGGKKNKSKVYVGGEQDDLLFSHDVITTNVSVDEYTAVPSMVEKIKMKNTKDMTSKQCIIM